MRPRLAPGGRAGASWRRYRLLLTYAARYRLGWLAILLVTVAATGLGLLVPLPLKIIVDHVFGSHPLSPILAALPGTGAKSGLLGWAVALELVFFAAASALDVVLTFLWIKVGQAMVNDLSCDLFARAQRRSLRHHAAEPVGDTMVRVASDSWALHTVVDELLFTPLHATITIVGVLVVMAQFDGRLTLLAMVVTPAIAIVARLAGRPIRRAGHQRRNVAGLLSSHVQQTLAGMPVVQAFGQEERHRRRFAALARQAVKAEVAVAFAGGVNSLGSGLVNTAGSGIVLFAGAAAVLDGHLTTGGLLVFLSYVGKLQTQLGAFGGIYTKLQAVRANTDRVVDALRGEQEVRDASHAEAPARVDGHLRIEHASFGYDPRRPVLHDISLEARPGETVAIVGATGAGKSTLVSLIPRFFDPDSGRVLLDGRDLQDLRVRAVRDAVSLVLQEPFLFPITMAENIAFGRPEATRAEIEEAARAANAHEFISRLPEGYDTDVGERGATLSGGERQRVSIARALLKDAPILILDEPTSALDAATELLLLGALKRLMAGRTTFIIAHRLSTIRAADRILVVDGGRIVERGDHQELLQRGGAYARLHELQTGAARETAVAAS